MTGLKRGGSASTIWSNVRRKISAAAVSGATVSTTGKSADKSTGGYSAGGPAAGNVPIINPSNGGETSRTAPEKKKRARKPKTEGDGEKPPPRKRGKKDEGEVKLEPVSSPIAEAITSSVHAEPGNTFSNGNSFTPLNGGNADSLNSQMDADTAAAFPNGTPFTLRDGETMGDDLTSELLGEDVKAEYANY